MRIANYECISCGEVHTFCLTLSSAGALAITGGPHTFFSFCLHCNLQNKSKDGR